LRVKELSTGNGDEGFSSLKDGEKIRKDSDVFEALGTLDKLSSYIGLVKATLKDQEIIKQLTYIQGILYKIGSSIADPIGFIKSGLKVLIPAKLKKIEKFESKILEKIRIANVIVIPGKNQISAHVDIARTICREFERKLVKFIYENKRESLKVFIPLVNRLGDYLYALARYTENKRVK